MAPAAALPVERMTNDTRFVTRTTGAPCTTGRSAPAPRAPAPTPAGRGGRASGGSCGWARAPRGSPSRVAASSRVRSTAGERVMSLTRLSKHFHSCRVVSCHCHRDDRRRCRSSLPRTARGEVTNNMKKKDERKDQISTDQGWRRGPRTQRKPMSLSRASGTSLSRRADRRFHGPMPKEPPRTTRTPPAGCAMLGPL
jgi:hypothetical protein